MKKIKDIFPKTLLLLYVVVFILLAINPYKRDVWFVENMTILPIVVLLVILYVKGIRFSNISYVMMGFLIFFHTIGGHYSFARVPFGFITNIFGFERNMFDRLAHFSVGLYAFPIAELVERYGVIRNKAVAFLFALFAIISLAAVYEIFEWQFAIIADPVAGIEVLGSQGDIWDAQKDMLSDTFGAVFALVIYFFKNKFFQAKKMDS